MIKARKRKKQKQYRYIITLNNYRWPRHIADELMNERYFFDHLIAVTDMQNDQHMYGKTYRIAREAS